MTVKPSERAQYAAQRWWGGGAFTLRGGHVGVAPILLHEAHTAAQRGREATATTGTSGDWGARLMLLTLIRVTERLLFTSITTDVSKAGFHVLFRQRSKKYVYLH